MEKSEKHKKIASKIYKLFLYILIVFQIVLIYVEIFFHFSFFFILNGFSLAYFIFRLNVFLKVEEEAKQNGMTLTDYMNKFKKR